MARVKKRKKARTYSGLVKLREKVLANGHRSLYFDVYQHGKRSYQFLGLYLTGDSIADADTIRLAETKRSQMEIELQSRTSGIVPSHIRHRNFISYFEEITRTKSSCNWQNALNYLKVFFGEAVTFEELTPTRITAFRDYLAETLHPNTAVSYLATTKAAFNRAVKEELIPFSPAAKVDSIKRVESQRAFLTIAELRKLDQTPCPNKEVKRAFMWACYSGQSRCDVRSLRWSQIQGSWLYYHRGKTRDELVAVALGEQALEILGERGEPDALVFPDLPANRYIGIVLVKWAQRAGITKNVTTHVARHTFATMSITSGGDIYVVSKQLGHKHIKTTQIYAKVVDERRQEVANSLPSLQRTHEDNLIQSKSI